MPSQLKRLARNVEHSGRKLHGEDEIGTAETYIHRLGEGGEPGDVLCWDLQGPGDSTDVDTFWKDALGKNGAKAIHHEGFLAGFIVGAAWVWDEFKAGDTAEVPTPEPE